MTSSDLLLDTCAVIWISQDEHISPEAEQAISTSTSVRVSVMTSWELGMLVSRGKLPSTRHPLRWFEDFVEAGPVAVEAVDPDILVSASYLPSPIHRDPMDRILIATARERDLTIVTRDSAILSYGAAGHVKTLAC